MSRLSAITGAVGFVLAIAASGARMTSQSNRMLSNDPYSDNETTFGDCTCTKPCGTSVGKYYLCDWCNVDRSCSGSKWAISRGHYDHCAYEPVSAYEMQSASRKMSELWLRVRASRGMSRKLDAFFDTVVGLVKSSMRTTFDNNRDVLPSGRTKAIHAQGVVCQFELDVPSTSPYTGSLSPGKQTGLVRLGGAFPATLPDRVGDFPGMAVKFLRSGVRSGNFVALHDKGAFDHKGRFFEATLSNHIAPPDILQALQKFQQASGCVSMVGLSHVCMYDENGTRATNINFPYELIFEPHGDTAGYNGMVILSELERIPAGTRLYNVYALASPKHSKAFLGTMTAKTDCHTTLFGDNELFFQHQRMEEDFKLKPEWIPDVDVKYCEASARDSSEWKCMFNQ